MSRFMTSKSELRRNVRASMAHYVYGPARQSTNTHVSSLLASIFATNYFTFMCVHDNDNTGRITAQLEAILHGGLPVFLYYWYRRGEDRKQEE